MTNLDTASTTLLACFLLCFCVLLCVCLLIRPLLLSVSTYTSLILLVLLLWITAASAFRCFIVCIVFVYIPLFLIHTHARFLIT
uniref:Probable protein E5 n=1 Tax=Human papillomavirus type 16 TaxID=333760 RepID=A0A7D7GV32_HPV16|nr:E5 [Human papillomavirus 16]